MTWWRVSVAVVLFATMALPAAIPFVALAAQAEGWQAWSEGERLLSLAGNTLSLILGTLVLCGPVGIVAAVLLYRTDLPWRLPASQSHGPDALCSLAAVRLGLASCPGHGRLVAGHTLEHVSTR